MKLSFLLSSLVAGQASASACSSIVDIVVNSDVHNTLQAVVTDGDYADILAALQGASEGQPLTLMAPTDAAFATLLASLPFDPLDTTQANIDAVKNILLYHVFAGAQDSATLVGNYATTTLQTSKMIVKVDGTVPKAIGGNEAVISGLDVNACNGVVHVVDSVITPPPTIAEIAAANTNTLFAILAEPEFASLLAVVTSGTPLTVFAPTDAAFAAAGVDVSFAKANAGVVGDIIAYHVLANNVVFAGPVSPGFTADLTTANTQSLRLAISSAGAISVNGDSNVVVGDVLASNGVVHVIDKVLTPPPTADYSGVFDEGCLAISPLYADCVGAASACYDQAQGCDSSTGTILQPFIVGGCDAAIACAPCYTGSQCSADYDASWVPVSTLPPVVAPVVAPVTAPTPALRTPTTAESSEEKEETNPVFVGLGVFAGVAALGAAVMAYNRKSSTSTQTQNSYYQGKAGQQQQQMAPQSTYA